MSETDNQMQAISLAAKILQTIWTEIDKTYKMEQVLSIWSQIENNTSGIARKSGTLPEFISRLCVKFNVVSPGASPDDRLFVMDVLSGNGDISPDEILIALRDYPQLCVLQVRIWNDEKKKQIEGLIVTHASN